MRLPIRMFISALAVVGLVLPLAAQTSPPPPIVKVEGLRQISAHVQIIPDNSVPLVPNVGYVIGDQAVLVIDTGLGPPNGAAVFEVAKRLAGPKPLYLVTTHVHPEHDLGAHPGQQPRVADELDRVAEPLLGMQQDGLVLERILAQPQRLAEAAAARCCKMFIGCSGDTDERGRSRQE